MGVMGDGRTYDYTLARGVTTTDFMTADWARIPYDVLDKISVRIVNEVRCINRIVYDITSKPATLSGNRRHFEFLLICLCFIDLILKRTVYDVSFIMIMSYTVF